MSMCQIATIPRRSRIARPTRARSSSLNSRAAIGSSSASSRSMCRSYKPTSASTACRLEDDVVTGDNSLEHGADVLPSHFELVVLGGERLPSTRADTPGPSLPSIQ